MRPKFWPPFWITPPVWNPCQTATRHRAFASLGCPGQYWAASAVFPRKTLKSCRDAKPMIAYFATEQFVVEVGAQIPPLESTCFVGSFTGKANVFPREALSAPFGLTSEV